MGTIWAMDDDRAARELLADKLRLALVMSSEGFEMKREQLRRRFRHALSADAALPTAPK